MKQLNTPCSFTWTAVILVLGMMNTVENTTATHQEA
jgi:hypothetical protein